MAALVVEDLTEDSLLEVMEFLDEFERVRMEEFSPMMKRVALRSWRPIKEFILCIPGRGKRGVSIEKNERHYLSLLVEARSELVVSVVVAVWERAVNLCSFRLNPLQECSADFWKEIFAALSDLPVPGRLRKIGLSGQFVGALAEAPVAAAFGDFLPAGVNEQIECLDFGLRIIPFKLRHSWAILKALKSCGHLKSLRASWDEFDPELIKCIPDSIERLSLSFHGGTCKTWLFDFPNMEILLLSLYDRSSIQFPVRARSLRILRIDDVTRWRLRAERHIPELASLAQLPLEELHVSFDRNDSDVIAKLTAEGAPLKDSLKVLSFGVKEGRFHKTTVGLFGRFSNLEKLLIGCRCFVESLKEIIRGCKKLRVLELDDPDFGDEHLAVVADGAVALEVLIIHEIWRPNVPVYSEETLMRLVSAIAHPAHGTSRPRLTLNAFEAFPFLNDVSAEKRKQVVDACRDGGVDLLLDWEAFRTDSIMQTSINENEW